MYCRNCSYSLEGCPSGKCPECGYPFHAKNRRSYLADPSLANNRQKRQLAKGLAIALGLFLAFSVWNALPAPYAKLHQIDLNSGHRRVQHFAFGWLVSTSHPLSRFGAFADKHLDLVDAPEWRPFLTQEFASLSAKRVNHRFHAPARELERLAELFSEMPYVESVPLEDRKRLARAALSLLQTDRGPYVQHEPDEELVVHDCDYNVIAAWNSAP